MSASAFLLLGRPRAGTGWLALQLAIGMMLCAYAWQAMLMAHAQRSAPDGADDARVLVVPWLQPAHGRDPGSASVLRTLRALPGVQSAAAGNQAPYGNSAWSAHVWTEGDPARRHLVTVYLADEVFLSTLGLVPSRGRRFAPSEYQDYTGANKAREGKFEAADGGTLFLDEIGNLPLTGQMKLLRVLETGRFERLGSNRERHVTVRVISATNADLSAMIRDGSFREDLYYRLNAIELSLPPLAERPGDILPLAERFRPADKPLGESARAALLRHAWPGNVRELRNVIQRAGLLAMGERIEAADLNLPRPAPVRAAVIAEPERADIEAAIARAGGVIAQAAADLGMSRQALYRRMERFGIKAP